MSHLVTATFQDDQGFFNVPTAGVMGPDPIDPRKAYEVLKSRGWQPIYFPTKNQAISAAEKSSRSFGEGLMHEGNISQAPKANSLWDFILGPTPQQRIESLSSIKGPSEGQSLGQMYDQMVKKGFSPAGFASTISGPMRQVGQVAASNPNILKSVQDPTAKFFLGGTDTLPLSPIHKLLPAIRNITSGELAHAPSAGSFWHEHLMRAFKQGSKLERGFVDPLTNVYFSESLMETLSKAGSQLFGR